MDTRTRRTVIGQLLVATLLVTAAGPSRHRDRRR